MRNTTKLKHILQLYTLVLDMEDDLFYVTLTHKHSGETYAFEDKNYTGVLRKAFSFMSKELKKKDN